ncbi:hypothetical protein MKX03_019566, partial [Papaver bracteatum]
TLRVFVKRRLLDCWKMVIGIIWLAKIVIRRWSMWEILVLAANVVTNTVEMYPGICCISRLWMLLNL